VRVYWCGKTVVIGSATEEEVEIEVEVLMYLVDGLIFAVAPVTEAVPVRTETVPGIGRWAVLEYVSAALKSVVETKLDTVLAYVVVAVEVLLKFVVAVPLVDIVVLDVEMEN